MEFFLFAGLMAVDMLFFFYLASNYTYVESEKGEKGGDDVKKVPDDFLHPSNLALTIQRSQQGRRTRDSPMTHPCKGFFFV
jgi:hypothetical protein